MLLGAVLACGVLVSSCNSDDNNPVLPTKSKLEGTWEAQKVLYTIPTTNTEHSLDFATIKRGCAVDVLTLTADKKAVLKEENKVNQACDPSTTNGSYTTTNVVLGSSDREVVSVNDQELVLRYFMNFENYGATNVKVTYIRK